MRAETSQWRLLIKIFFQDDGDLTVLGEVLASIPVDVRLGKLIVYGFLFGVLVISFSAILEVKVCRLIVL